MPLVSIIVPVFNSEKTINQCIDSVIQQTFSDWELLLVNDGSKDKSGEICDEYAKDDSRIRVFHKVNGGVSSARNTGLECALGKWVMFLDSDDYLNINSLDSMIYGSDDCDLVFSSIKLVCSQAKVIKINNSYAKGVTEIGDLFTSLNDYMGLTMPVAKLLRLSIINKFQLRFDYRFSSGEDTLFMYQYSYYVERIRCVDIISYNYVLTNGLSQRKLSLYEIDSIINELSIALAKLQERFNFNIERRYFDCIEYFVTRYDFSDKDIRSFYEDLIFLSKRRYFNDMIKDHIYINKGVKRMVLDLLLRLRLYRIAAFWVYNIKKIYF